VRFWDSDNNLVILQSVGDESLPSGRDQVWAVGHGSNTNNNNIIIVAADGTHTSGIINPSLEASGNIIIANGTYKNPIKNIWGALGDTNEHTVFGKATSPATNDPQFLWKTSGSTPPLLNFEAYDGTTTKTIFQFDWGNNLLRLGDKDDDVLPVLPVLGDGDRPGAGTAGRMFFNSDDGQLNIDDGTNWTLPDGTTTS